MQILLFNHIYYYKPSLFHKRLGQSIIVAFRLGIYRFIFDFSICHSRKYLKLDKWAEVLRDIEQK